jgi:hypothetical protein
VRRGVLGDKGSWKSGNLGRCKEGSLGRQEELEKRELEGDKMGVGKSGSIMEGSFGRHGELKERERERVVELYAPHKTTGVQVVGWMVNLLVSFVLVVKSLLNI